MSSEPKTDDEHRPDQSKRRAAVAAGLCAVQSRIADACARAGRHPEEVDLIVVTKLFPVRDVVHLLDLGVRDIAENRDQEAGAKVGELTDLVTPHVLDQLSVHFVGQVQTNKARSLVRYADVVQSVDRLRLVQALDRATGSAMEAGERTAYLDVTVQLDLEEGSRAGRGGIPPQQAPELAQAVADSDHLRLRGVMAVAPPDLDEAGAGHAFERLARTAASIREVHPEATWVSAGMSGDLELAIAAGATHLRVGSAILGSRPTSR